MTQWQLIFSKNTVGAQAAATLIRFSLKHFKQGWEVQLIESVLISILLIVIVCSSFWEIAQETALVVFCSLQYVMTDGRQHTDVQSSYM